MSKMSEHEEKFEEYFKEANKLALKIIRRKLTSLEKVQAKNAFKCGYYEGLKYNR